MGTYSITHEFTYSSFPDNHSSTKAEDWLVKVGKFDLSKKESHEQRFKIKQIIPHPNHTSMWDKYGVDKPDEYDIGELSPNKRE